MDAKLKAVVGERDDAKRQQLFADIIKEGMDTYAVLPLMWVPEFAGIGPRVDPGFPVPTQYIGAYMEKTKHRTP